MPDRNPPAAQIRRTGRARDLRLYQTDVERKLWRMLRGRQLGGFKFRRQYPIGRYFADFACAEARIVVELDGGQHGVRLDYEAERTAELERRGWRVVRFWNSEVIENAVGVAEAILSALKLARS